MRRSVPQGCMPKMQRPAAVELSRIQRLVKMLSEEMLQPPGKPSTVNLKGLWNWGYPGVFWLCLFNMPASKSESDWQFMLQNSGMKKFNLVCVQWFEKESEKDSFGWET